MFLAAEQKMTIGIPNYDPHIFEASRRNPKMNPETLVHFQFGQGKPERRSMVTKPDGGKTHIPGELRCAQGVCEVAWKPNQQNGRELDQIDSMANSD
jgi:hypothetical protein